MREIFLRKKQSQHAPVTLDEVPDGYVDLSVQARGQGLMQFFRMCEAARGGPLDGRHLVCDDDPTCVKCIPEYKMVIIYELLKTFRIRTALIDHHINTDSADVLARRMLTLMECSCDGSCLNVDQQTMASWVWLSTTTIVCIARPLP